MGLSYSRVTWNMRFHFTPQGMHKLLVVIIMMLCLDAVEASDSPPGSMDDYVTCAVYYRMIVGSLSSRFGSDLAELVNIQKENMYKMMVMARSAATEEYGKDLGEDLFQDQWQAIFMDMTDQINRNYDNIAKLKYRYNQRCRKLGGKSSVIGSLTPE